MTLFPGRGRTCNKLSVSAVSRPSRVCPSPLTTTFPESAVVQQHHRQTTPQLQGVICTGFHQLSIPGLLAHQITRSSRVNSTLGKSTSPTLRVTSPLSEFRLRQVWPSLNVELGLSLAENVSLPTEFASLTTSRLLLLLPLPLPLFTFSQENHILCSHFLTLVEFWLWR